MSDEKKQPDISELAYYVTRENGTERPFSGVYWNFDKPGLYVDLYDGQPLFLSTDKFPSSCGWPAFSRAVDGALKARVDKTHGMVRMEVRAKGSDAHLGHVFDDGPAQSGGLRYCINSAAVRFIPLEELEEEGYGKWVPVLQEAMEKAESGAKKK